MLRYFLSMGRGFEVGAELRFYLLVLHTLGGENLVVALDLPQSVGFCMYSFGWLNFPWVGVFFALTFVPPRGETANYLMFSDNDEGEPKALKQACYLPSTSDGLPMMGKVPGKDRSKTYVSAGHTCWVN